MHDAADLHPPPGDAAWAPLAAIAAAPWDAATAGDGRPRVALLGGGAALEVVLATGCTPIALPPETRAPFPLAARYLGPKAPVACAGRLERLLRGELTDAALAVATSRHEIDALLYHAAKEVLRRGEGAMFPALHLHVLLGGQLEPAAGYSLGQVRRLADRLATVSGQPASPARLREAIAEVNVLRRTVERLQALRFAGQVSGEAAMTALAAARSLPPEAAVQALASALGTAASRPAVAAPRLLLMSSGELHHRGLHAALETAGGRVVLEDGDWGARAFGPEIAVAPDEEPIEAVARAYGAHAPGLAVYPHTARHAWFYGQAAREEVDAIVFHIPLDEAPLGWDYPRLKAHADRLGKPSLLLRADPLTQDGCAALTAETSAFLARLPERRR